MNRNKHDNSCPCGSGTPLSQCCGFIINGAVAPTAEALMRSRYTAYVLGEQQYLLNSWHVSTRPQAIEMDASIQWLRLNIVHSESDRVEFIATFRVQGKAHSLHENSRFVFENGKWLYLDGEIITA